MLRALVAAVFIASFSAFAEGDGGVAAAPAANADAESLRRELEKTRADLKDLREELNAKLATQTAGRGWKPEWVSEAQTLELFEVDGYLRVRPELFHRFDLNRAADPSGYSFLPRSPVSARDRTMAGVNMRFRLEPTLNISEDVRIRTQIDALDNLVFGTTPDYAYSRNLLNGFGYDRDEFSILSGSQAPPRSGINALTDSIAVKRVWGEVQTPVGILKFGRMASHWGLGMVHNDGSCLDCDSGDTVDRLMFLAEPFNGWFIMPALDFNAEGPTTSRQTGGGQPIDLTNSDDAHSFVVAIARRDTELQTKQKLEAGQTVFNFGVHFTYRWQRNDPQDLYGQAFVGEGTDVPNLSSTYVQRIGTIFIPDLWAKVERKNFRVEAEVGAVLGTLNNRAESAANALVPGQNQALTLMQFGGVLQGEYRLLDGALTIGAEVGFASGDSAPGFGNYPRRKVAGADNNTQYGDIDGPQYACQSTGGCTDAYVKNFRFNRDYRVDMILFREILGGITDALYVKPSVKYRIADGFFVYGSGVYSRSIFIESTPSAFVRADGSIGGDASLGVELNAGARYETDDGFFATFNYGVLFPLSGLADARATATGTSLEVAQALRGALGIHF